MHEIPLSSLILKFFSLPHISEAIRSQETFVGKAFHEKRSNFHQPPFQSIRIYFIKNVSKLLNLVVLINKLTASVHTKFNLAEKAIGLSHVNNTKDPISSI